MADAGPRVLASGPVLDAVRAAARAAMPEEACGLLLGRAEAGAVVVERCVRSRNVAADPTRRFEVDPAVRLRVQREARDGRAAMVGLYHSHPAGAAVPSDADRRSILEPGLVWLIAGPDPLWEVRAWLALDGAFREVPLAAPGGGQASVPPTVSPSTSSVG